MDRCRSCDAPIIWAHTRAGKAMPIDATPFGAPLRVLDGNLRMTGATVRDRHGRRAPVVELLDGQGELFAGPEARYRAHFATCPDADDWRHR